MIISEYGRQFHDDQNKIRVVRITDVDTNAELYPMAVGVDFENAEFFINLRFLPPGLRTIPNVGDFWWIEVRVGRFWTLLMEESNAAVGLSAGDTIPIAGNTSYDG